MNLETLKNNKIVLSVLALVIISVIGIICIIGDDQDKLTVSVGGETLKEDSWLIKLLKTLKLAEVFGNVPDEDYLLGYDGWVLAPSQQVTMEVWAYNDESMPGHYRAYVYDPWRIMYTSDEEYLLPNEQHGWSFTYTASPSEGTFTVYFETEKKDYSPHYTESYEFDDIEDFDIIVIAGTYDPCYNVVCEPYCLGIEYSQIYCYGGTCDATGDCQGYDCGLVDGECGYEAPAADPCDGVICADKCVAPFTRLTNGVCVGGSCDYTETMNSPTCGWEEPDPCDGVMCPPKCDGTTYLYGGSCSDGDCTYSSETPESAACGFNVPDPCIGIDCPDKCDGTTRLTEGYCFGGECDYNIEIVDSPLCGFDSCIGVTCPDDCDATTLFTDGICTDGSCDYTQIPESPLCGYVAPDPDAPTDPNATPAPTPDGIPDSDPRADKISDTSGVSDDGDLGIFGNFIQWLKDLFNMT